MFVRLLLLIVLFFNSLPKGLSHVGQPCNAIFRICLASHSYCDDDNICRCKPDYPVNISLHSCKKGRQYSERCEYSEECSYYDPNSYCSQLPYRSTCECHTGFTYNEVKKLCVKIGGETPKTHSFIFPTALGLSLAFASILCCLLVAWHVCKRRNFRNSVFFSNNAGSQSHYFPTNTESQRTPTAPCTTEALPTYDTVLSLKISEDSDPPPSYEEVIGKELVLKTEP